MYCEEDTGQSCISVRWALSCKIKNGENGAQDFEEIKDFPTDSPCCSRIGVRSTLVLIASNKWKVLAIDKKQLSFRANKSKEQFIYDL